VQGPEEPKSIKMEKKLDPNNSSFVGLNKYANYHQVAYEHLKLGGNAPMNATINKSG